MKRTILTVTALAVMLGLWVLGAAAATAATGSPAQASCKMSVPVSKANNRLFQVHLVATCGDRVRAVAWWNGSKLYGTYMLQGSYSTACDDPPGCQDHPDGTLRTGGWQDRRTGNYHCEYRCSAARTTALVLPAAHR